MAAVDERLPMARANRTPATTLRFRSCASAPHSSRARAHTKSPVEVPAMSVTGEARKASATTSPLS